MPSPEISIIIPTLNEAHTIVACLMELQKYRPQAEIMVVDGNSTDDTRELAQPWADQVILSQTGRARQMNTGAANARGDILVFLHADTQLPEHALSLITESLQDQSHWGRFAIELEGQHPALKLIAFCMHWRSKLTGIATGDQAIFVRRATFERVGQYPDLPLMEDIVLSSKLKKISPPACLNAKVKSSARRWEQFGVYKIILLMWSLRLRFFLGTPAETLAQLYREGKFWKL